MIHKNIFKFSSKYILSMLFFFSYPLYPLHFIFTPYYTLQYCLIIFNVLYTLILPLYSYIAFILSYLFFSRSWNEIHFRSCLILFVLIDTILLSLTLQKRTMYKKFFLLLTHLSNIFAPYIKNLETYFAILICFEF